MEHHASLVSYKFKDGRTGGSRIGSTDETVIRDIIKRTLGATVTSIKPYIEDDLGIVETFSQVKQFVDLQKAAEENG